MSFTLSLILGMVVGILGSVTFPGTRLQGWIASMGLGAAGACVGEILGHALYSFENAEIAGLFLSLFCAAILVTPYHVVARACSTA